jgi:hypothetical protein
VRPKKDFAGAEQGNASGLPAGIKAVPFKGSGWNGTGKPLPAPTGDPVKVLDQWYRGDDPQDWNEHLEDSSDFETRNSRSVVVGEKESGPKFLLTNGKVAEPHGKDYWIYEHEGDVTHERAVENGLGWMFDKAKGGVLSQFMDKSGAARIRTEYGELAAEIPVRYAEDHISALREILKNNPDATFSFDLVDRNGKIISTGFSLNELRAQINKAVKPKKDSAGADQGNASGLPASIGVDKVRPIGRSQAELWDAAIKAKENGGRWDDEKFRANLRAQIPDITDEQADTLYNETKAGAVGDPVVRARAVQEEARKAQQLAVGKDVDSQSLIDELVKQYPPVPFMEIESTRGSRFLTPDGRFTRMGPIHATQAHYIATGLGLKPAELRAHPLDLLLRAGAIRINGDAGIGVELRRPATFLQMRRIKDIVEVSDRPDYFAYELKNPDTGKVMYQGRTMKTFDRDMASYRSDLSGPGGSLSSGINVGMLRDPKFAGMVKEQAADLLNLPRALQSSADLSAPLRQGLILTLTDPRAAGRATSAMLRSFMGPGATEKYENIIKSLGQGPNAGMAKDAGLYLASSAGESLNGKEEAFMSKLAMSLPHVKFSEQAYVAYLDVLRHSVFDHHVEQLRKAGIDLRTIEGKENLQAVAHFINVCTGRGDLPKFLEDSGPLLNGVFFSPRLVASRVQVLNPLEYAKMPKATRRIAMKQMAQFVATSAMALALAKAAGATVSLDPDSPDFLKIRVGHVRYDILGGLAQPARFGIRFSYRLYRNFIGKKNTESKQPINLALNFARSKLSPSASFAYDAMKGKDFSGKRFKPLPEIGERVVPMIGKDAYEAFKDEGLTGVAKQVGPGFFGVGVSSYK